MSSPIPQILAAENGPFSQVRTGTVTSASSTSVFVLVGGTQIEASFLGTYVPVDGHLVALLRQDATWLCLGNIAGSGQNEIQNPSFELSPPGLLPSGWFLADLVGTSGAAVVAGPAPDGSQFVQVTSGATASSYLYSSPIAVTAGEVFNVSAFVTGFYTNAAPETADAALVGLWFASPTDLYPTTSSGDTVIVSAIDVLPGLPFTQISGQVTAPVSGFMRLALRSSLLVDQSLGWDFVSARRVG